LPNKTNKPLVLYISYGADEWAHTGFIVRIWMHQVDAWIKEIWDYVQNDYKDKTALVLPTDRSW
jgi:hypothetical protein